VAKSRYLHAQGTGTGNNYAYLVSDDKTKEATIIDPANPPEYVFIRSKRSSSDISHRVLPVLKQQTDSGEIKLVSIINTHQ
jgi:hydroxyacylglutathione hydrolase